MPTLTVFEASPAELAYEMRILALDVDLGRLRAGGAATVEPHRRGAAHLSSRRSDCQ